MPYWKFTLSEEEIWSLAAYIRTLHKNDAEKITFTEKMESKRPRYDAPTKVDFKTITQDRDRLIEEGKRLYEDKYACLSCHRIGETGGRVGPELTRVGFRLNSSWIYRWVRYPQLIMPHTKMPNFGMSDHEAQAVTLYLTTLKGQE
jgi:mono/diheme cytochrome c family protein